eukprot:TRINITY_DN244_c0_g1_i1.p1 TRINITY_DN244_c0_g1~~TRINITY_DN244_c0_g1_i1.p1  ORF type:complete len:511 (+),score=74.07 TRINITY_DN244_c0_g1_i1:292-1824(+)
MTSHSMPIADLSFDPKNDKFPGLDHRYHEECEINNWLKLENETTVLPPIAHDTLSLSSAGNEVINVCPSTNGTFASAQHASHGSSHGPAASASGIPYDFVSTSANVPVSPRACPSNNTQHRATSYATSASAQYLPAANHVSSSPYPTFAPPSYSSSFSEPDLSVSCPPSYSYTPSQSQQSHSQQHFNSESFTEFSQNNSGFNPQQQYQYSQFVQASPFAACTTMAELQQFATPQLLQLFAQFQQMVKHTEDASDTEENPKKRPASRPASRKMRSTRPKVVESKGGVQCRGRNRKKGTQCRNASLMEYIGPRPQYCAEHIELDPNTLYVKCRSLYHKERNDNKGCKEVVLKEFGVCYKHYHDLLADVIKARDVATIQHHQERIADLLNTLEKEASVAKKKDGDLYQRKNKLIPKFQEMKKIINRAAEAVTSHSTTSPSTISQHSSSILGHSSHGHSHHLSNSSIGTDNLVVDLSPVADAEEFLSSSHSRSPLLDLSDDDMAEAFSCSSESD